MRNKITIIALESRKILVFTVLLIVGHCSFAQQEENWQKKVEEYLSIVEIERQNGITDTAKYLSAIYQLSFLYVEAEQYDSVIKYSYEADALFRQLFFRVPSYHIFLLYNLADACAEQKDYSNAVAVQNELIRLLEYIYYIDGGKTFDEYEVKPQYIVHAYEVLSSFAKKISDAEITKQALKNAYGLMWLENIADSCENASNICSQLSDIYYDADSINEAIYYKRKECEILKRKTGKESEDYLDCLHAEATLYALIGNDYLKERDYQSALEMYRSCDSIYGILKDDTSYYYFLNHTNIINCLTQFGAIPNALNIAEEVEPLIAYYLGECSLLHQAILRALNSLYYCINDFNNSDRIQQKIAECNEVDSWTYYTKASLHKQQGNLDSAEYYLWKSVEYDKKNNGDLFIEILVPLSELLKLYDEKEEIDKFDSVIHYCNRIFQANLDNPELETYQLQNALALAMIASKNRWVEAEDFWLEAYLLAIKNDYTRVKWFLDAHVKYVYESYANGHVPFHGIQDGLIANYIFQFISNYSKLSKTEREYVTRDPLYQAIHDIVFSMTSDSSNLSDLYEYVLYNKQQTLNSDIEFSKQVKDSSNIVIRDSYDKLNKENERHFEREMRVVATHVGSQEWMLNSSYDSVRQNLNYNDIAVEYVRYWDYSNIAKDGSATEKYIALVARKDWVEPRLIHLCSDDELRNNVSKSPDTIYGGGDVSNEILRLLFDPIAVFAKKGGHVYFSSDGIIYNIALENILTEDGTTLGDKYNLIRCSSTRDIKKFNDVPMYASAVLYGGLDYDYDANTTFIAENTTRKGWNYLPGTLQEVSAIGQILKKNNIKTETYSGKNGTEESFRQLTGKKTSIIHVATHGFFYNSLTAQKMNYFVNLSCTSNNTAAEDFISPMQRSGLMLSGGNKAWKITENNRNGEYDGVLLASEVIEMNLLGTNLLVLSACETGLGDLTVEGIMGLQRAFKLAGVETIVMSLWRVDDDATSLMMEEFYKNLASGKSKRESFNLAQKVVKKKYKSPQYWAAFIMLD